MQYSSLLLHLSNTKALYTHSPLYQSSHWVMFNEMSLELNSSSPVYSLFQYKIARPDKKVTGNIVAFARSNFYCVALKSNRAWGITEISLSSLLGLTVGLEIYDTHIQGVFFTGPPLKS